MNSGWYLSIYASISVIKSLLSIIVNSSPSNEFAWKNVSLGVTPTIFNGERPAINFPTSLYQTLFSDVAKGIAKCGKSIL